MPRKIAPIFLLMLFLFSLTVVTPLAAQSETLPLFEPGPCPVDFNVSSDVECGMVTVPQDRENPDEGTVRIAVAVFAARSPRAVDDPLILLDGGPGSRTLDSYQGGLGNLLGEINYYRDVIIFDYRGIGHSEPALVCPDSAGATNDDWIPACRDLYVLQGYDFTHFTTRDNAADAADIIRALGYDSYNIWGGSYGSSVALTVLRDHPENVRAAIVTAMQPPQGDLQAGMPIYFQRTLEAISAICQADEACAAAFPGDLTEELAVIVERVNENPLPIMVHGVENELDGSTVISGLSQLFKDETNIPVIPGLLAALYAEQYDVVVPYVNALNPLPDPLNPIGAWLSMRCTDSILVTTPEAIDEAFQSINPAFQVGLVEDHQRQVEQCELWGARVPTEADPLPAVADTPVLIISGALDMYSSQEWLDSTLETLPNGQGFMLPYHMHYVIHNPCAAGLLTGFIEDPGAELDSSCIAEVPAPTFRTS